ncbi:hypothetical protein SLS56_006902 [Neofusicoccum ribis]|uniref:Apple domain-containing protein n=1 Tax=Neofusicoccum ribis TaxID=45134 RepID=A0ABR3SPA5_9PEZI
MHDLDFSGIVASEGSAPIVTVPLGLGDDVSGTLNDTIPAQTLAKRGSCEAQNSGSGPTVTPDTPEAFTASSELSNAASSASTPDGYTSVFTNLKGATSSTGYMGYSTLQSYDTSFFFERDPSLDPDDSCSNPSSTNVIKCVLWGGPITPETATNTGQWRNQFQVVVAGSNGYVKSYSGTAAANIPSVDGYDGGFLNNKAINAVTDCNGVYTYMGYRLFNDDQPFSPSRCADICNEQSGSFSYGNTQDSGVPVCAPDVSYLQTAGVSFCLSYLGFTAPTVTQTATAAAATSTETTTVYQTTTITDATTLVVVTSTIQTSTTKFAVAKRDVVATPASASAIQCLLFCSYDNPDIHRDNDQHSCSTGSHRNCHADDYRPRNVKNHYHYVDNRHEHHHNKCAISYPHIIDVQVSDDKQQAIKDCLAYCNSESNCKYWEAYYYMGGGDSTYALNHGRCATFAIDYSASNLYCPHSWNIGYSVGGKKGLQL